MHIISLYIPKKQDLWFKKKIKEDPNTMDYNAGYDLDFFGYDKNTGTINTDLKDLENNWFFEWVENKPSKFYFYIKYGEHFIGEIYAKYFKDRDAYEIGIVILCEYRNKGFSTIAIKKLCEILKQNGVKKLFHEVPSVRIGAIKADLNNGFKVTKINYDGMLKFGEVEKMTYLEKLL